MYEVNRMKKNDQGFRDNLRLATSMWGKLPPGAVKGLKEMEIRYSFSIALGDLLYLDCRWYVTHSALLRLANRARCTGIRVQPMYEFCDASVSRWVFKATVYKSPRSRGFVGYGDADPSNVSTLVHGAEMRVAETRAVNRALRKAYGIGLCSVEELGSLSSNRGPTPDHAPSKNHSSNGSSNGQPRLRDQLCLLIRQHNL